MAISKSQEFRNQLLQGETPKKNSASSIGPSSQLSQPSILISSSDFLRSDQQERQQSPIKNDSSGFKKSRSRHSSTSSFGDQRAKCGLFKADEYSLPVKAVQYFYWYRVCSVLNFIMVCILLLLDILMCTAPTGFARKTMINNEILHKFLALVYLFEISFPVAVGVYCLFAGAFDYIHLRTFSRLAVCQAVLVNTLKIWVCFEVFIKIQTGSMTTIMVKSIETYSTDIATSTSSWDDAQSYFRCCGVVDFKDWTEMKYYDGVLPASCCGNPQGLRNKKCNPSYLKKGRLGCLEPLKYLITSYLGATIFLNMLHFFVLCATISCAYKSWIILCQDEEFVGDEFWRLAKYKYKKQSKMSFFFLCLSDNCWRKIRLGGTFERSKSKSSYKRKIHPLKPSRFAPSGQTVITSSVAANSFVP